MDNQSRYIWQQPDWPCWRHDLPVLFPLLIEVSQAQGRLLGRLQDLGEAQRAEASLGVLTEDVLKTSEIEGESLDVRSVRSSLARRLGVDVGAVAPVDRHVEGVVEMVLDATTNCHAQLTAERLFGWHAALFPTGYSGMVRIGVGQWRTDARGPMQVVSGPVHRPRVHFQAPPAATLPEQMAAFLAWANTPGPGVAANVPDSGDRADALLKAGLAHLWFVTLHPFEDGNGRIARAIGDLFLARSDGSTERFYSLSAQIERERKAYYDILEQTQKGSMDVTAWLSWFLATLGRALASAHATLDAVLMKARFWQRWGSTPMNPRQIKLLNRLLDGFDGKLTSSRWASMARCSQDTALRDITQLLDLGVLRRSPGGGRSTGYELAVGESPRPGPDGSMPI